MLCLIHKTSCVAAPVDTQGLAPEWSASLEDRVAMINREIAGLSATDAMGVLESYAFHPESWLYEGLSDVAATQARLRDERLWAGCRQMVEWLKPVAREDES